MLLQNHTYVEPLVDPLLLFGTMIAVAALGVALTLAPTLRSRRPASPDRTPMIPKEPRLYVEPAGDITPHADVRASAPEPHMSVAAEEEYAHGVPIRDTGSGAPPRATVSADGSYWPKSAHSAGRDVLYMN